jgi:hypothetical protein
MKPNASRRQAPAALLVVWTLAAPGLAQTDAPDTILRLELDPATGDFTAEARIEAPSGDVRLPRAEWLTVSEVTLADAPAAEEIGAGDVIPPGIHRARDITLRIAGRFPAPGPSMTPVAASPEASWAIGPAWFPVDATAIRDHALTVAVPEGQTLAATGAAEPGPVDGEARYRFTGRSADLGVFLGPYAVAERRHDDLPLRTYFHEADAALSERYFDALGPYLDRYEAAIGPYPYDAFAVVSATQPVGLGLAGLTYVSRDILRHPYMTGRSLAHEVLHSWWGNAVAVDYASGNWAEGLTTFQADYALAEDAGPEDARRMRIGWIRALAALPPDSARPLAAFRSAMEDGRQAEGYGKAAMVFHMLRDELGPETFAAGIRSFYAQNRDAVAGWDDLRRSFETEAGRDLGWFFDQWLTRAGLPQPRIVGVEVAAQAGGTYAVTVEVAQTDPAYRLRLPLVFDTEAGPQRRVAQVEDARARVTLTLPDAPVSVRLDPDFDIARLPLEGELPPTLASFGGAVEIAAITAGEDADLSESIRAVLSALLGDADVTLATDQEATTARRVLVVGPKEAVRALRPAGLGPPPEALGTADTWLWIERDETGRLWTFLAYEDPEDVQAHLRSLPFFLDQTYLGAGEDGISTSGTVATPGLAVRIPAPE